MSEQLNNEIIHRWQGGQSLRGIARDLSLSRWQVSRTIRQHQAARVDGPVDSSNSDLPAARESRGSKLDAFESIIGQLLKRYPHMTATRIFEELKKQGYTGGDNISALPSGRTSRPRRASTSWPSGIFKVWRPAASTTT